MLRVLVTTAMILGGGLAGLTALAPPVFAWGHLPDFGIVARSGTLILDVIADRRILFCVETTDPRYTQQDVELLVEASLSVWLSEVEDLVGSQIAIESECDVNALDLLVVVGAVGSGRAPDGPADFAFRARLQRGANWFSAIGFNTQDTNAGSGNELVFMSALDFLADPAELSDEEKLEFLRVISADAPQRFFGRKFDTMELVFGRAARKIDLTINDADAVSARLEIAGNPADLYPVMIHEFGHAFGLCDMRPIPYAVRCNREWRTAVTRNSVMAFGGYVLRDDDIEGIRSLFERFIKRPFLDPRIFGDDDRQVTDRYDRSLVRIDRPGGGPIIGTLVGDCRTVLTSGHGLFPAASKIDPAGDLASTFTVRAAWLGREQNVLNVDWDASGYRSADPARFVSPGAPQDDFFILPLADEATGCVPVSVDRNRADAAIENGAPFTVVSLGGHSRRGRDDEPMIRHQTSGNCEVFARPFGHKFYQDPTIFLTDCDLTRDNAASPALATVGGELFLVGISAGSDRLAQHLRADNAYNVLDAARDEAFQLGPTYRGIEGELSGANIFVRLEGALLETLVARPRAD
jgi:hypothetical protein